MSIPPRPVTLQAARSGFTPALPAPLIKPAPGRSSSPSDRWLLQAAGRSPQKTDGSDRKATPPSARTTGKPAKPRVGQAAPPPAPPRKPADIGQALLDLTLKFAQVNPMVPLPQPLAKTEALARKLQPFLDVPLAADPKQAQKQLYLLGNALVGELLALHTDHTAPIGLAIYQGDRLLSYLFTPRERVVRDSQHPVTAVAVAEDILRADLPRGTPPAFGLKLLEPGWRIAAEWLDRSFTHGQAKPPTLPVFARHLGINFQPPPSQQLTFSEDEYNAIMMNAHRIPLGLKVKDDLERMSYGVQLFRMLEEIAAQLKKHAPRRSSNDAKPACQLMAVYKNPKTNADQTINLTPQFRRLFKP